MVEVSKSHKRNDRDEKRKVSNMAHQLISEKKTLLNLVLM